MDVTIKWLKERQLLKNICICECGKEMKFVKCSFRTDGYRWECRSQHCKELAIRMGSWFEQSNMNLEEIIKMTYWWSCRLTQIQIRQQTYTSEHTSVDIGVCFAVRF